MGGWLSRSGAERGATRLVFANNPRRNEHFPSNRISNTKYTLLTFLPKNLMEQFGRFMNIYFLLIATLQLFPTLAPVNPLTTWVPLSIIFLISAIKEGIDDIYRYKADEKANETLYYVYRNGVKTKTQSQDIRVGDIIFIQEHEQFPCDVVILKTSDASGGCYIQTANLDGETDFKSRRAVPETMHMSELEVANFTGIVECAAPNREIYKFDSRLKLDPSTDRWVPLDNSMTALQATILKNTDWVIGLVVYTGNETKIGMAKTTPPTKWTKLDRYINLATLSIFVFQLVLVIILGTCGNLWRVSHSPDLWYLADAQVKPIDYVVIPLRFLLLMSMMIPISLKVSMDIVKYVYALLIGWDLEMVDKETGISANANSTSLSEDLGQVEFIFTDKTGTLTENVMNFAKCSIRGQLFGVTRAYPTALEDPKLHAEITTNNDTVWMFMRALALCNTVVPVVEHGVFEYRSSSPDEEALVKAARQASFFFKERKLNNVKLELPSGVTEEWIVLVTLEFSSERKRMSVLMKNVATEKMYLFTKGADDKILPQLKPEHHDQQINEHLELFARQGLRTLCIAYREVSEAEYQSWLPLYEKASTALEDRELLLADAFARLERDFEWLGITAIEDKLQEGVPEAIVKLREAGIRIWMLTGDKYSTAVQIATSCNLIEDGESSLLTISGNTAIEVANSIDDALIEMQSVKGRKELSIIIQGDALSFALEDYADRFLELALMAHTVICCRVTPHQKAEVVDLIKRQNKLTLAIGDGGNDVSMIQKANVGVGIAGHEGLQAARAADFSIAKFRFLVRLLLVHGRYSYRKTSFVALYCFHKSMFIAFIQIFFAFFSGLSGTSFFDAFSLTTYNGLFTGLPILFYSLDKDVSEENLLKNPILYEETRKGMYALWLSNTLARAIFSPYLDRFMNKWVLLYWFIRSLIQSSVVFFGTYFLFGYDRIQPTGQPIDFVSMSSVAYGICITIQTVTILIESNHVTILNHLAIWGTLVCYYVMMVLANVVAPFLKSVMYRLFADPTFWFTLGLTTLVAFFPFLSIKYMQFNFFPMKYQIIQYLESLSTKEVAKMWSLEFGSSIIVRQWVCDKEQGICECNSVNSVPLADPGSAGVPLIHKSVHYVIEKGSLITVVPRSEIQRMQKQKSRALKRN